MSLREWFRWFAGSDRVITIVRFKAKFSAPDAGGDKCLACGVERRHHDYAGVGHSFREKEK